MRLIYFIGEVLVSWRLSWLYLFFGISLFGCVPTPPEPIAPNDRFVKKQANGKSIGLSEGPWSCVEDTQTGLHWEVKAANEKPQFSYSTYSWKIAEQGFEDGGSCADDRPGYPWVQYGRCDTQDLIDHVNQRKLCGFEDWRLPSSIELRSIMFEHDYPGERKMPFPLLPRIVHSPYWTSDSRLRDGRLEVLTIHAADRREFWVDPRNVATALLVRGSNLKQ